MKLIDFSKHIKKYIYNIYRNIYNKNIHQKYRIKYIEIIYIKIY